MKNNRLEEKRLREEENRRRDEENRRREEERQEQKRLREEERLQRGKDKWEAEMSLKRQELDVARGIRQENIAREDEELRARDVKERELRAATEEKERVQR